MKIQLGIQSRRAGTKVKIGWLPIAILVVVAVAFAQARVALAQTRPTTQPNRWEKDIEKFEAADREKMPPPGGIVAVGSSSIRFWKADQAFPNAHIINRGFGGSFSGDAEYFARRIVTKYKPRLVIFYGGENDLAAGKSVEEVKAHIRGFVEIVRHDLPGVKIVLIANKPNPSRWKIWPKVQQVNEQMKSLAGDGVEYVSIENELLGPDGAPDKSFFRADGLHLNDRGYEIWNSKLKPYVDDK